MNTLPLSEVWATLLEKTSQVREVSNDPSNLSLSPEERREILDILASVRSKIDELLAQEPGFPNGYCQRITALAFALLEKESRIQELQRKYGSLRKIYGRLIEFDVSQNALQFENSSDILDLAGGTFESDGERVSIYPASNMEPIDRFETRARILETHYGSRVYPNIYFPEIADTSPILFVDQKSGEITLETGSLLTIANIRSQLQLAWEFLFMSEYSDRRLEPEQLARIERANQATGIPFLRDGRAETRERLIKKREELRTEIDLSTMDRTTWVDPLIQMEERGEEIDSMLNAA